MEDIFRIQNLVEPKYAKGNFESIPHCQDVDNLEIGEY